MAEPARLKGKIFFNNLTRNLKEGESPDTEFKYIILESLDSLRSQVFIHKNDIIDGAFEDYKDGVEVNFTPERVTDERFNAAIEAGEPIRRHNGRMVTLASAGVIIPPQPVAAEVTDKKADTATTGQPKTEQKSKYSLEVSALSSKRLRIVGLMNGKPAEMTFVVSALGLGSDDAEFSFIGSESLRFYKHHPGLKVEDGLLNFDVEYEFGSLNIEVRCLESNQTQYATLWK